MTETKSPRAASDGTTASRGAGPTTVMVPDGDTHPRHVCLDCGFIHYRNPVIVVGAVCDWQDRILLCRRAIEPRQGLWTIPAGYMELHESPAQGAAREAEEEAGARLEIDHLLAVYDIPRIGQVQLIFNARLASPDIAAGVESLEVDLFAWDDIPWDEIAFPTVRWALDHFREARRSGDRRTRVNPDEER